MSAKLIFLGSGIPLRIIPRKLSQSNDITFEEVYTTERNISIKLDCHKHTPKTFVDWEEVETSINSQNVDLVLVCNFGKIIPNSILGHFPNKWLNVHFSKLPQYRGAVPVQAAILDGKQRIGITILEITPELDAGKIISQREYSIDKNANSQEITKKLSDHSVGQLADSLLPFLNGEISPKQQLGKPSYCYRSLLSRENAKIDWGKSNTEIHNHVRAYFPEPVAWTTFRNKSVQIIETSVPTDKIARNSPEIPENTPAASDKAQPGSLFASNGLIVNCGKGHLKVERLKVQGKKEITGDDFISGYLNNKDGQINLLFE